MWIRWVVVVVGKFKETTDTDDMHTQAIYRDTHRRSVPKYNKQRR